MTQPDTIPDDPNDAVEMVAGTPGAAESQTDGAPDSDEGVERGRSRRWVVVAVAVIVAVAGLGAWHLGQSPPRPDVLVVDPFSGSVVDPPAAPARPLAERWSQAMPSDRELVGIGVVDDTVFMASRDRSPDSGRDEVLVQALAADGSMRWQESVPGSETAVVLADDDTTTLLGTRGHAFGGQATWKVGGVAVLDPSTGTMHMHRDQQTDGLVRVRPDGMLEINDPEVRLELVDPMTGQARLVFDTVQTTNGNETWTRRAHWSGSGWVVPTTGSWEITDRDGAVEFEIEGAEVWPAVFPDLVIHWTDSEVIARRRPSGDVAWRVQVAGGILHVEPLDRSAQAGQDARFVVYTDNGQPSVGSGWPIPLDEAERLLIEDGALVGPASDDLEVVQPDPRNWLEVVVDGTPVVACRQLPGSGVADMCPEGLALLDADQQVLAAASPSFLEDTPPTMTWRATDAGILTIEEDQVRLYRWGNLSEAWSIPMNDPNPTAPTVVSSADGVVVALLDSPDPDRITWYG